MRGKYFTEPECGHMTLKISWSQLRMFDECRQKVKLLKSGSINKVSDKRGYFAGTVLDRVVRDWLADPNRVPGGMVAMVEDVLEREYQHTIDTPSEGVVRWKTMDDRENVIADVKEAARQIEPALNRYVLPYQFWVDYRFDVGVTVPDPRGGKMPVLLVGAMDILVYNPDEDWWMVLDVKMTRNNDYWKKTQGQMTFYDLATFFERGKHTRATALLQPLCDQQVKPIPQSEERTQELLARIKTFASAFALEDLPFTDKRSQCTYCEMRHACPRWKTDVDERGNKTLSYWPPSWE